MSEVNRNGSDVTEGLNYMGMVIALLENMPGMLDPYFENIMTFLLEELDYAVKNIGKSQGKNFQSMVLQAFAMCFHYNAAQTFVFLEK